MKNILLAIALLFVLPVNAQVASWAVLPDYSSIKLLGNNFCVVSKDRKFGIIDCSKPKSEPVLPLVYDSISPFRGHAALLWQNDKFVAYVSDRGEVHSVENENYIVVGPTVFSDDGYLPVFIKDGAERGYYYLRATDHKRFGPFTDAGPVCEGYGKVKIPKSLKHVLDGNFINTYFCGQTGEFMKKPTQDFDFEDVDFLSTVSNGKSVFVVKKRVFVYDFKRLEFAPMTSDGNVQNKKSRVSIENKPMLTNTGENTYSMALKQGSMTFDIYQRLIETRLTTPSGEEKKTTYPVQQREAPVYNTDLKSISFEGTKLLGLAYKGNVILTAQFDDVTQFAGSDAVVKKDGKFGVVHFENGLPCSFTFNDDRDLGFDHKSAKTSIKVKCPTAMEPDKLKMYSDDDNCIINSETRKAVKNVEATILTYECDMNIPEDVDLKRNKFTTNFHVSYDEPALHYLTNDITYYAWYRLNYNVELGSHQVLGNNTLVADVYVKSISSDAQNYYKEVEVNAADTIFAKIEKVTEEQYRVKLENCRGSKVRFSVSCTEEGCPSVDSPEFTIEVKSKVAEAKPVEQPVSAQNEAEPKAETKYKIRKRNTSNTQTKKKEVKFYRPRK